MRFTAGDLRGSIAAPESTVARLRASLTGGAPENVPRSPQRQWIEASLRRYYLSQRNPDVLIGDYHARTAGKGTSASKRTEIANGEAMLQEFLTLEEPEPTPRIAMHRRSDQRVAGHVVSMGHDLVYERPDGYLVREVWTDGVVRRPEDRQLLAAATLLHAEQLLGERRVPLLEIWQLRLGVSEQVSVQQARRLAPALRRLLDRIERETQTQLG